MADKFDRMRREDIEAQIVARAWSDDQFAQELYRDPQTTIQRMFGEEFPEGLKVEVHVENTNDNTWHLVIPVGPADDLIQRMVGGGDVGLMIVSTTSAPPCTT